MAGLLGTTAVSWLPQLVTKALLATAGSVQD